MNDAWLQTDLPNTALVLMDYHPVILASFPQAEALMARVVEALDMARPAGLLIVYACVDFVNRDYNEIPDTNTMFAPFAAQSQLKEKDAPGTGVSFLSRC